MKIEVKYEVWEIVEHIHATVNYMVIWYEYIDWYWVRYICIEPEKWDQKYLYWCELKKYDEKCIWFISFIKREWMQANS